MSFTSQILDLFGDEIQHLHGNLFRVKRDKIKLAKSGLSVENGKIVYGNPRWFLNKDGELEAKGIEKQKMDELKNSIQDEGLENPIRLRVIESKKSNFLEIVNGERRFRCLTTLCDDDLKCFDPASGEEKNASEVYEWIDCRIEFMDDETALRVALKPNETSEIIGDLASLNVVKILRQSGFSDQEILKSTGKSISWLRETEKIISLDEKCLDHFENEKINRKVALELAAIENVDERIDLLGKIFEAAQIRHAEKISNNNKKKEKAESIRAIEEAAAHIAKKKGDDEAAEQHEKKAKRAEKQIENTDKQEKKLKSQTATATSKDLEAVNGSKPLSHKKIRSIYIDLISQIIESEGYDEDGNSYGIDLNIVSCLMNVLEEIMNGNKDAMDVLLEHCPLTIEEDTTTEEEIDSEGDSEEEVEEISSEDESQVDDEEYDDEEYEDDEDDEDDEDEEYLDDDLETDPSLEAEFRAEAKILDEDE